jgi:hypothetical protein
MKGGPDAAGVKANHGLGRSLLAGSRVAEPRRLPRGYHPR